MLSKKTKSCLKSFKSAAIAAVLGTGIACATSETVYRYPTLFSQHLKDAIDQGRINKSALYGLSYPADDILVSDDRTLDKIFLHIYGTAVEHHIMYSPQSLDFYIRYPMAMWSKSVTDTNNPAYTFLQDTKVKFIEYNIEGIREAINGELKFLFGENVTLFNQEELDAYVIGHESAHLHGADEKGADIAVIDALLKRNPASPAANKAKHFRAVSAFLDIMHLTAIAINHHFNHKSIPSNWDVLNAYDTLKTLVDKNDTMNKSVPPGIRHYYAMQTILRDSRATLTPLVVEAAKLYMRGAEYFCKNLGDYAPVHAKPFKISANQIPPADLSIKF